MNIKTAFLFIAWIICWLLLPGQAFSGVSQETLEKVAFSSKWLKLVHYRKTLFGNYKSLVDGSGFFLAQDGKSDPLVELQETIKAFNENREVGKLNQPATCAFPLRKKYLAEQLGLRFPEAECKDWKKYLKLFKEPEGVSLVFSTAYPNNPASMFGHLLLKIDSRRGVGLLDSGINYAAFVPPDVNAFAFGYYGITGGYIGAWSVQPYYVKVNTYSNVESRDLWEYRLNFSRQETMDLLAHLWEIESNGHFDYFFFDENCAYQILSALEVIKPEWELDQHIIYMIPGEGIKNLANTEGAVKEVVFRPALSKLMYQQFDSLSASEKELFHSLVDQRIKVADVESIAVLEASMAYLDFMRHEDKKEYKSYGKLLRSELLQRRAELGNSPSDKLLKPISKNTRPDLGHDSYAAIPGVGYASERGPYVRFRIKSAYHDLMNNDLGYRRYSHIDFPSVEFRYFESSGSLELEQIGLLSITSLQPWSVLERRISWKVDIALRGAYDIGCLECKQLVGRGGIGSSWELGSSHNVAYLLGMFEAGVASDFDLGWRVGPGLELGVLFNPIDSYKFKLAFEPTVFALGGQLPRLVQKAELAQSYSISRNLELRQTASLISTDNGVRWEDIKLQLHYFFN